MVLRIETFDNARGGNTLYKALTHPHVAAAGRALVAKLAQNGPVALVDPQGALAGFAEILGSTGSISPASTCRTWRGWATIFARGRCAADRTRALESALGICRRVRRGAADRAVRAFAPGWRRGRHARSDAAAGPPPVEPACLLDPVNFATNFALFRDEAGLHTRLVTANYWAGYGSADLTCWLTLFDAAGRIVAEWDEHAVAAPRAIAIDSREVRARFGLGRFPGNCSCTRSGRQGTTSSSMRSTPVRR